SKDGALSGVNVAATKQLKAASGLELIASGGVCSLSDIRALNAEGIDGVILGKAIFERVFTVGQALEIIKC
ncbi:MAG: 1-(5-phosphoribosyl)-5-((5-phosphoribosylamino)methylideneamino)imidazole-4-carboxamide isomerase, partial [Clostridiales bacterium]|nr:1-(5-phosphoribosyl)-5-((5-phosphoribosylamino)methylideneamino)imidazole-4-carboxamide isomerase [Clostridiales bacterium]